MDHLNVGSNAPIKLKVSVQTEALAVTSGFLYHSETDEMPYSRMEPFDPSLKTGWKSLDKGNEVGGKVFRVITFFTFFNSFPNEETFNLAVEQIKGSYQAEISGGNPSPFPISFTIEAFFTTQTCMVESGLKLL